MVDERHPQAVPLSDPELRARDDPIERPGRLAAYPRRLSHQREAAQRLVARRRMQVFHRDGCLPERNRSAHVDRRWHVLSPSLDSDDREQQPGHQRQGRPDPKAYPSSPGLPWPAGQADQVPGRQQLEGRGRCIGHTDRLWMPGVVTDRKAERARDGPEGEDGEVPGRTNNRYDAPRRKEQSRSQTSLGERGH